MKKTKNDKDFSFEYDLLGIILFSLAILGYFSLLSKKPGIFGFYFAQSLKFLFGRIAFLFPAFLAVFSIYLIWNKNIKITFNKKIIGAMLFFISLFPLVQLVNSPSPKWEFLYKVKNEGGGIIGVVVSFLFLSLFGKGGSYLVVITIMLISLYLIFGDFLTKGITIFMEIIKIISSKIKILIEKKKEFIKEKISERKIEKKKEIHPQLEIPEDKKQIEEEKPKEVIPKEEKQKVKIKEKKEEIPYKQIKLPILELPPLDLLKVKKEDSNQEKIIEMQKEKILETLANFGLEVEIVEINQGPRIIRYELMPEAGIKVREIVNLADDLALHLAAAPIRVEAPIPGKSAIGIEVPNKTKSIVYLREIIEQIPPFSEIKNKLIFALGKDIAGKQMTCDLTKMPHLLIAGATGSGKSVCINSIIASFLFKCNPNDVKFLIIDPKRVELTLYNDIPYLISPVVVDAKLAASALSLMVDRMDERYEIFAKEGVRNIEGYNEKNPENRLPYIVIFIDELADLMFQTSLEVEKNICRIAQLARATGIHLVIATQRPSVNVITGLIKANIPSRISFAVASQTDSRTILDMNGAEKLLGEGDMLYLPVEESKPIRIQGAFISEKETKDLVEFWKNQAEPEYDEEFLNLSLRDVKESFDDIETDDKLFKQAVEIILVEGKASASLLQRKMNIGYPRAGRLIDLMEKRNIIGPGQGSKPREVLITSYDEVTEDE